MLSLKRKIRVEGALQRLWKGRTINGIPSIGETSTNLDVLLLHKIPCLKGMIPSELQWVALISKDYPCPKRTLMALLVLG